MLQKIKKTVIELDRTYNKTNKDKLTKDVRECYPRNGKTQRGDQIITWKDNLQKGQRRTAKGREMWKRLGKAYIDRQPDQSGCL